MRIVAGRLGGRSLRAPKGSATRPTAERVRAAIFNVLGSLPEMQLEGARVADLYAGTGALGLEALSRGASSVDFYECAPGARRVLAENIRSLDAAIACRVHGGKLPGGLGHGEAWDLVLIDPPWEEGLGPPTVEALLRQGGLAPGATVVIEEAYRRRSGPEVWRGLGLRTVSERRYGDTAIIVVAQPRNLG